MKKRSDFVTNSSSSSFILAFKNEEMVEEFVEYCNDYGYESMVELVKSFAENSENKNKDTSLDLLYRYYQYERADLIKLLDKKVKKSDFFDYREYVIERNRVEKSEEFKREIDEIIKQTDYEEKKKQIEESEFVINGTIWDTNGGMLEWAIRNGFLESEFRKFCILCWNVG